MLSQYKGFFVVCLNGVQKDKTEVDQVVVVEAGKKVAWECVEEYVLNMDPSVFNHCVCEDEWFRTVNKLKRLEVQPV